MRKEILTHLAYLLGFSVLVIIFRGWFQLDINNATRIGLFLAGGLIGTLLPDIDHLIYVYVLKPQDLTSMRVDYMVKKREFWSTLELLSLTRDERKTLIFHTAHFQVIFWVLAFLVLSSSASVFGRGLVLAFALHLIVDQLLDLLQLEHLHNWFAKINLTLEKEKYVLYWIANIGILLLLGLVL